MEFTWSAVAACGDLRRPNSSYRTQITGVRGMFVTTIMRAPEKRDVAVGSNVLYICYIRAIYRLRMMIDVMIDVRNAKCQIVDRVASCAVRSEILVSTRIPGMYIHRARLAFSLDPCGLQT